MPEIEPTKKPQSRTNSLVPLVYYQMMALRFQGLTYRVIAKKVEKNEDWVRHLFCKGGALHDLWYEWVEREKKQALENAVTMMHGHLENVVRTQITVALEGRGAEAAAARKYILDLLLGDPTRAVIQNNTQVNVNTLSEEKKTEIRNAFKNFGVTVADTEVVQ